MRSIAATARAVRSAFRADRAWIVGGPVRDRLLKRPFTDTDVATVDDPMPGAEALARRLNGRAFFLDEERGVVRLSLPGGAQIDFSRLQGRTLPDDLARRDFTVNAMAVPLADWDKAGWTRALLDPFKGRADLAARRLRAVAARNLKDDPLRLLRAYRLAAGLGLRFAPGMDALLRAHRTGLRKVAGERLREELLLLFGSRRSHAAAAGMERSGLWDVIVPEVKAMRATARRYYGAGGVLKHTLDSLLHFERVHDTLGSWFPGYAKKLEAYMNAPLSGHPRYAHLKWALFLHDVGKPATARIIGRRLRFFNHEHVGADMVPKIAGRLRCSNDEIRSAAKLVRNHMRPGNLAVHPEAGDKAYFRFFRDLGDDALGMLIVSLADHLSYLTPRELKKRSSAHEVLTRKLVRLYHRRPERIAPKRLLNGHDVMKAFDLKPSPFVGRVLQELDDAQSDGVVSTKEEALAHLRARLDSLAREEPAA